MRTPASLYAYKRHVIVVVVVGGVVVVVVFSNMYMWAVREQHLGAARRPAAFRLGFARLFQAVFCLFDYHRRVFSCRRCLVQTRVACHFFIRKWPVSLAVALVCLLHRSRTAVPFLRTNYYSVLHT